MNNKVVILIPAYEPTLSLITLLKELTKYDFKIIVVNDGSKKEYDKIFKDAKKYAHVIEYELNKGKGAALKTGLKYINKELKKDYYVITMDCDGQHSVKDAIKLCDYIKENPKDLAIGKRLRSKKTPIKSRLGNGITRFFYRLTTGLDVYDTQTGLRAFSDQLVPFLLSIEGNRFEYEMNALLKCPLNNIKVKELEIETIYIDNNSHTHFKIIRDSILVYKEIFKFLMSSFVCSVIDYFLFSIFIIISDKLILSNIITRIISGTINFTINKNIVFKNKNQNNHYQLLKYIFLAVCILIINTTILKIFVDYLSINKFIAKILTEVILFFFSWVIQRNLIFSKK